MLTYKYYTGYLLDYSASMMATKNRKGAARISYILFVFYPALKNNVFNKFINTLSSDFSF